MAVTDWIALGSVVGSLVINLIVLAIQSQIKLQVQSLRTHMAEHYVAKSDLRYSLMQKYKEP